MTIRKPTDTADERFDISPIVEDFHTVGMVREHLATIGWTTECRQVEGGQLEACLAIREVDSMALVQMAASHRVIGNCRSPDDLFTIAISVSKNRLHVNGHILDQKGLLVIPPKTDVDVASVDGGWSALSLLVSVDMLAEHLETHYNDHPLVDTKKITPFKLSKNQLAPFRRLVAGAMSKPPGAQTPAVEVSEVVAYMISLLAKPEAVKRVSDRYHWLERSRIITRAKDYVHEHLAQHIRVTDLYQYCGVSLSTLERIFRRELGITPNAYVQAARLHDVRCALLDSNHGEHTIADIALSSGFTHMGRFSGQYRAQFGRLPSEERSLINKKF
jgi:AraC-like DNA-binding protein